MTSQTAPPVAGSARHARVPFPGVSRGPVAGGAGPVAAGAVR
ncbi:hypothetical protein F558DRAFT_01402 [Streptomyces sp. AmelKG-A3]|nr:hypothetical protein GA0115247_119730 [Streptomyces sp. PalvLS-984]SDC25318.1 hypothetical protein F558DRAFT_01402 [Streptomyces sp. AmelKG-A3]